jgi:hypothetical protein
VVQAPTRDSSDFCIAHSAEPALFMPEKAKRTSTPKRFLHMDSGRDEVAHLLEGAGRIARRNAFSLAKASSMGLKVRTVRRQKADLGVDLFDDRIDSANS